MQIEETKIFEGSSRMKVKLLFGSKGAENVP